jgi:hypothetical protein
MSAELSLQPEQLPVYAHWCPNASSRIGANIDEFHRDFIHCRCFTGNAFFAAQDAAAVRLDLERDQG